MKTIIKEPDYMAQNKSGFRKFLSAVFLLGMIAIAFFTDNAATAAAGGAGYVTFNVATPGAIITAKPPSTESINNASPELLKNEILKKVIQTHPNTYPLDTIMHYLTLVNTDSWQYQAFDTPYLPYTSSVTAASTAGAFKAQKTINPVSVEYLRTGSCLYVPSILASDDNKWLSLYVTNIAHGANTADVIAINNNFTVPAIPSGTEFIIGPTAVNELTMQVDPQIPVPQPYNNYNQLFMCQVEMGDYAKAHEKNINWGWSDIHDYTLMDFRARRAMAYYFGIGKEFADPIANKIIYSTEGIYHQITNVVTAPATWTDAEFIDLIDRAFTNAMGSEKKILLAGNDLISNMSKTPTVQKQMAANSTEVVFGITFNKITTNLGTLLVRYDPILTQAKLPGDGVILDPEFLVKTNFDGTKFDKLDLRRSGVRRVEAESIAEASSALLRNRDTHAWIKAAP